MATLATLLAACQQHQDHLLPLACSEGIDTAYNELL